jgi:hypothetical protein
MQQQKQQNNKTTTTTTTTATATATATATENDTAAEEALFHNARAQSNMKTSHFMLIEALHNNIIQEYQTGFNWQQSKLKRSSLAM